LLIFKSNLIYYSFRLSVNTDRTVTSASEVTTVWSYTNSVLIVAVM